MTRNDVSDLAVTLYNNHMPVQFIEAIYDDFIRNKLHSVSRHAWIMACRQGAQLFPVKKDKE